MGNMCNQPASDKNKELDLDEHENEPEIEEFCFMASYDKYLKPFEDEYNLLKYFSISTFTVLFQRFSFGNSGSKKDKTNLFYEEVEKVRFIQFLDTKILNHHFLYSSKATERPQIFREFMSKIYDLVNKGMTSLRKRQTITKGSKSTDKKLKKLFILAIGYLFTHGCNNTKTHILFNTFANDRYMIENNDNLDNFLYILFLISSYGTVRIMSELAESYPKKIRSMPENIKQLALEIFEVPDIIRLKDHFLHEMFKDNTEISYSEFFNIISKEQGIGWILSSNGIRYYLENNNKEEGPNGEVV
jgi:hypothetical protein